MTCHVVQQGWIMLVCFFSSDSSVCGKKINIKQEIAFNEVYAIDWIYGFICMQILGQFYRNWMVDHHSTDTYQVE